MVPSSVIALLAAAAALQPASQPAPQSSPGPAPAPLIAPAGAAPVPVGRVAQVLADPPVCAAEARADALRAELAGLANRNPLPFGLERGEYARLLRMRIAIAEQDEAAITAILADLNEFDSNAIGLLRLLADIRGDTALLAEATRRYDRSSHSILSRAEVNRMRREQAAALLMLARSEPERAAVHIAAAKDALRRLMPATGYGAVPGATPYAERLEAAANVAAYAEVADVAGEPGAAAAWRAAVRHQLAIVAEPKARLSLRATLAWLLVDAGSAGGAGASMLLAEAAALARDGEAELVRQAGADADLYARLLAGFSASWPTPSRITNLCLQRAGWRVLAASADLLAAEAGGSTPAGAGGAPAAIDAARQRLAAADRQRDGLPDWQHDASANVLLAQSWLRSARAASAKASPSGLASARLALDRARRFSARCFCAAQRREIDELAADPLLAAPARPQPAPAQGLSPGSGFP